MMLSQIVPQYTEIYPVRSAWIGMSAIRSVVSLILEARLDKILPNRSRSVKNLSNLVDQIRKNDPEITREILSDLEILRPIGNDATHLLRGTNEDYISSLKRLVRIVEWHVQAPPQVKSKN